MPSEKIIRVHDGLPEGRFLLEGIDTAEGPTFTVSEVGKTFFDRSSYWVRLQEADGLFVLDGWEIKVARSEGNVGVRRFTLSDIENVAHALASHGRIDAVQLTNALLVVKAIAKVVGYLA